MPSARRRRWPPSRSWSVSRSTSTSSGWAIGCGEGWSRSTSGLVIEATVAGFGSIFVTYFMEGPTANYTDLMKNDAALFTDYRRRLMESRGLQDSREPQASAHLVCTHRRRHRQHAAGGRRRAEGDDEGEPLARGQRFYRQVGQKHVAGCVRDHERQPRARRHGLGRDAARPEDRHLSRFNRQRRRRSPGGPGRGCRSPHGSPACTGAPWANGYRAVISATRVRSARGNGRMLTTIGPANGPAGSHILLVRYIETLDPRSRCRSGRPARCSASSNVNEHPSRNATRSSRQSPSEIRPFFHEFAVSDTHGTRGRQYGGRRRAPLLAVLDHPAP